MAKILVVVLVVGLVLWLMFGRRRGAEEPTDEAPVRPRKRRRGRAQPLLACARCGVQLPRTEALMDAAGQVYCSQAHRQAGPAS